VILIRQEQMRVFEEAHLHRWLIAYLQSCYPIQTKDLGRRQLSEFITAATSRARLRGLQAASEIRKYVHVSFLLGPGFETDPGTIWARRILDDEEQPDPGERICALEEAVLERLESGSSKTKGVY
jgi:hypothetical protein